MDGLSLAEDRVSILDAQQEWQPCELYNLHSNYAVLGNMQLAPHVRLLRLKSRGAVPNKGQPCELAQMLSV